MKIRLKSKALNNSFSNFADTLSLWLHTLLNHISRLMQVQVKWNLIWKCGSCFCYVSAELLWPDLLGRTIQPVFLSHCPECSSLCFNSYSTMLTYNSDPDFLTFMSTMGAYKHLIEAVYKIWICVWHLSDLDLMAKFLPSARWWSDGQRPTDRTSVTMSLSKPEKSGE